MAYDNTPTVNVTVISVYRPISVYGSILTTSIFLGLIAVKRTDNDGWALPGGYQERPESIRDAAIREVREETGINLGRVNHYDVQTTPDGNVNLVFWQGSITEDQWLAAKEAFVPNAEVSDIELKTEPWTTPFALHTRVVSDIFAWDV